MIWIKDETKLILVAIYREYIVSNIDKSCLVYKIRKMTPTFMNMLEKRILKNLDIV